MKQFVVILRGASGSGKSTIAKKLRDFKNRVVWLKVDNFKDFFAEDASLALEYVNGASLATLEYLLDQDFSVVVDGIFQDIGPIKIAEEIAKGKSALFKVFQLECSLEILRERDKKRDGVKEGFRKQLSDATIENLYEIVNNNYYQGAIRINTEKKSFEDVVEIIKTELGYD